MQLSILSISFCHIISRHVSLAGVPALFSPVRSRPSNGQLYMYALALFDIYGKYAAADRRPGALCAAAYNGGRGLPRLRGISGGLFGLLLC